MYNIIVTTGGGSGSTHVIKSLSAHKRPDTPFNPQSPRGGGKAPISLMDTPTAGHIASFRNRTQAFFELNDQYSIEKNMVAYLGKVCVAGVYTVLGGRICRVGQFFRKNNFSNNAFLLARHPLHAMGSFLVHQHPEKVKRFAGGLNSIECVNYYANYWNDIVTDCILGGMKVIRFEFVQEDIHKLDLHDQPELEAALLNINGKRRNYGFLDHEYEIHLKQLTKICFNTIYHNWEI